MKKLNAVIYNNLLKVFNDGANDPNLKQFRDCIIQLRKQFPTYNELLALDLWYMDKPKPIITSTLKNETIKLDVSTWQFRNMEFDKISILHSIGFLMSQDIETNKPTVVLKVRGIPSIETCELNGDLKQLELIKKVLNK